MSKKCVDSIVDASWHRNGISGVGFYAVLFKDPDGNLMSASLFDEKGYCVVYNVQMLYDSNVKFAMGNSWRGDVYEDELRPMVAAFLESKGSDRIGPFSMIPIEALLKEPQ